MLDRRLINHLRRVLPLDRPVHVRTCRVPRGRVGDCLALTDHYRVRIERRLPAHEARATLLHEFAHAVAWPLDGGEEHGEWFRRAEDLVARCYWDWCRATSGTAATTGKGQSPKP
jgi:hypothetical protein